MYNVDYNLQDGLFTISDQFDLAAPLGSVNATPNVTNPDNEYILSFPNLQNVKKITKSTNAQAAPTIT